MNALSLPELASLQVELSGRLCATSCRDYHSVWPVLRAARLVGGIDADRQPFLDMLGPLLQNKVGRRILIAGCADSALLSLVAGVAPATSRITIIDRCQTPLAVCRQVAAPGLLLETLQADLLACEPEAPYDLIVCHSLLPFFRDSERRELLKRFAAWLSPGGALILAVRLNQARDPAGNDPGQTGDWVAVRAAEARTALAGKFSMQGLDEAWRQHQEARLEGYYRFMAAQNLPYSRAQDAVDEFFRAGLTVTAVLPGGEGLSFMTPGWRSKRGIPGLVLQAIRS
jgi:trans-aconitate methyltransferase